MGNQLKIQEMDEYVYRIKHHSERKQENERKENKSLNHEEKHDKEEKQSKARDGKK